MAFDRVDWHSGGDYPDNIPDENGGTHIGMFLAWVIDRDLEGEIHRKDAQTALNQVLSRQISGRDFLMTECDEKLWDEDFNEQGLDFANDYYKSETAFAKQYSDYLKDYCDVFNAHATANGFEYESTYHVENTWENYDKLKPLLDQRFDEWLLWRKNPDNLSLDPKTQFLNACAVMAEKFTPLGFKAAQKGKILKKTSQDKDLTFAIHFEEDRYSNQVDVKMSVYFTIHSKKNKKWRFEQTENQYDEGLVHYAYLKKFVAKNDVTWNVTTKYCEASVEEIFAAIETQISPVFTLFENSQHAAEFLAKNGTIFNAFSEVESHPLSYLLCMGYKKEAECFLNVYVNALPKPWQNNIINLYKSLPKAESIRLNMAEFFGAAEIKMAYLNGLKLNGV